MPPQGRRGTILGNTFSRQPPPANPFSELLIHSNALNIVVLFRCVLHQEARTMVYRTMGPLTGVSNEWPGGNDICVATGMTVPCHRDVMHRRCTGKRLSDAMWSCFNKGWDVVFVWQSGCRSGSVERRCAGEQIRIPSFLLPPLQLTRLLSLAYADATV